MKKILSFGILSLVTMLAALVALPVFAGHHDQSAGDVIPGRYIVVLHGDTSPAGVAHAHGLIRTHTYRYALNGFAGRILDATLDRVKNDRRVKSVEPDRVVRVPEGTARPPGKNGGGKDTEPLSTHVLPTGVDRINADLNPTANIDGVDDRVDVDIAIIDTGIDRNHPDLNVYGRTTCIGSPNDQNGHGTHVAGSAAALDNGEGVVGVAPGARLWSIKVLDANGSGTLGSVLCGLDYVTLNAAEIEVANMSLGFEGRSDDLDLAIRNSVAAGIVYTVAAGNSAKDAATFSPANHPDVITVSAITDTDGQSGGKGPLSSWFGQDDTFAWFSNFGSVIELAAPGVDILSTWKDGEYNTISETSMASPHVAGAVALYIAANGRATDTTGVYAIRQALIDTAEPQSAWRPDTRDTDSDPDADHEGLVNVAWIPTGTLRGTVTEAATTNPIGGV